MSVLQLWLLFVVLPGIDTLAAVFAFVLLVATVLTLVSAFASRVNVPQHPEDGRLVKRFLQASATLAAATSFFAVVEVVAPSEEQIYTLVGGYVVTNTDGVEKLPANLVGAANHFLEQLQEAEEK